MPLFLTCLLPIVACGRSQPTGSSNNGSDDVGGDAGCTALDYNTCSECGECSPQTTTMSCVNGVLVCSCDLSCCGPGCGGTPPPGTFNCNGPNMALSCTFGSECCFEGVSNSCAPLSSAQCNACFTKGCYCSGVGSGAQTTYCDADAGVIPEPPDASTDALSNSEASVDGPTEIGPADAAASQ